MQEKHQNFFYNPKYTTQNLKSRTSDKFSTKIQFWTQNSKTVFCKHLQCTVAGGLLCFSVHFFPHRPSQIKTKSITAFTGIPVQTRHHGSCWVRMEVLTKERAGHWLVSWKLFACRTHWHHQEADDDDIELINLCDSAQEEPCCEDAVQE